MAPTTAKTRKERAEQRIVFLIENWERLDLWRYNVRGSHKNPEHRNMMARLVNEMKLAGVIAASTNWFDVNVTRMIKQARARRNNDTRNDRRVPQN